MLLENYFLPGDLERQIEAFIQHYNYRRALHSPGAWLITAERCAALASPRNWGELRSAGP